MAMGLLLAAFDFSTAHADEFHDWYDLEHIPERQRVPGFGRCERWIGVDDPTFAIATYDLATVDVMKSEPYKAIAYENLSVWSKRVTGMCRRIIRFEGTQTLPGNAAAPEGAGGFLLNAMNVSPEGEADFNRWYDEEHIPALAGVPGTLSARRYKATIGDTQRYVAIYHLASPDVTRGEAWAKAVDTPWSARVRPHFRDRIRILAKRYVRAA
ncbi:MAG: hypothetical protein JSS20_15935 [Proteobacteria bacterium]|nr:hypothetical protein [Pseudomonadota bacterium]